MSSIADLKAPFLAPFGKTRRSGFRLILLAAVASMCAISLNLWQSQALAGSTRQKTFEWMEWAPPAESNLTKVLDTHFPHALPSGAIVPSIRKVLTPHGVVPGKTLFGQSVCADEINNGKDALTNHFIRYFRNVFVLGGIGGAPFVGKTGWGAFAGHVADGGHIFVLFAPHVGISPQGEVGKYVRQGQAKASGACGALIGGYTMLLNGNPVPSDDRDDMEEGWLCTKLAPKIQKIKHSANPMVTLTKEAFSIIEDSLLGIVTTTFGTGNLVLLGGIQINMPQPYQDHFLPLHFTMRSNGKKTIDLMDALS